MKNYKLIKLKEGYIIVSDEDKKENEFCINAFDTLQIVSAIYNSQKHPITQNLIEQTVKFGGDTDTNASIIGELSNHLNNDLTSDDTEYVRSKLDNCQLEILDKFNKKF